MERCESRRAVRIRSELPAIARGLAAILLGAQLSSWLFFMPAALSGHADFRQLYTAGFMLRTGDRHLIYDPQAQMSAQNALVSREQTILPFNHLAYEAVGFAPLSLISYRNAYFVFLAFNSLLLFFAMFALDQAVTLGKQVFALCICFLPVAIALMQGQDSIVLLALFASAYLALHRRNDLLAGALIGLGMFKFQLVLPIAFLFLCWRKWRFVASFATAAVITIIGSILLVGWTQMLVYAHSLSAMSAGLASKADQAIYGISPGAMPNLRGLAFGIFGKLLESRSQHLLIFGFSGLVLLWAAKQKPRTSAAAFEFAIIASSIVSYHLLPHDWSVLLVPLSALAAKGWKFLEFRSGLLIASAMVFLSPLLLILGRDYFFLGGIPLLALLYFWHSEEEGHLQCPVPQSAAAPAPAPITSHFAARLVRVQNVPPLSSVCKSVFSFFNCSI